MDLETDGTVTMTEAITQWMGDTCTGSLSFSGVGWTSTSTTISFSGAPSCSGTITCSSGPLTCDDGGSQAAAVTSGTGTYTLEDGDDTLVVVDGSSSYIFTRAN